MCGGEVGCKAVYCTRCIEGQMKTMEVQMCPKCDLNFKGIKLKEPQMKRLNNQKFKCEDCEETFTY